MNLKQVIVVNSGLSMGKGKICAQVAHASLQSYLNSSLPHRDEWLKSGAKKVVLKATEEEIVELAKKADSYGIAFAFIRDAGLTQIAPGSLTALGLGPDEEELLDKLTGHLKLL